MFIVLKFSGYILNLNQEGHPLRKFSWGSLDSLQTLPASKGINTEAVLTAFHRKHYVPSQMKLAVIGPR